MGEALNWTDVTSRGSIGGTLRFISSPFLLSRGPGALAIVWCTGDVGPSRVCFSQFLSGKGVVFSPTVWQGSRLLSGNKGAVFRPNSLARGMF